LDHSEFPFLLEKAHLVFTPLPLTLHPAVNTLRGTSRLCCHFFEAILTTRKLPIRCWRVFFSSCMFTCPSRPSSKIPSPCHSLARSIFHFSIFTSLSPIEALVGPQLLYSSLKCPHWLFMVQDGLSYGHLPFPIFPSPPSWHFFLICSRYPKPPSPRAPPSLHDNFTFILKIVSDSRDVPASYRSGQLISPCSFSACSLSQFHATPPPCVLSNSFTPIVNSPYTISFSRWSPSLFSPRQSHPRTVIPLFFLTPKLQGRFIL